MIGEKLFVMIMIGDVETRYAPRGDLLTSARNQFKYAKTMNQIKLLLIDD